MNERGYRPSRTWVIVVSLGLAWIAYLSVFGPRAGNDLPLPAPELKGPIPSDLADYRWVLHDLDGKPVPFESYRGRTVFLNLWGTFCPPCIMEMPSIANLAGHPRLKDVAFLCVSTDESPETVRAFLKGKDWPMTVLRATELPRTFMTDGIPATFVIAPDGRIVVAELGAAQWDEPAVVDFLQAVSKKPELGSEPEPVTKPSLSVDGRDSPGDSNEK